MYKTKRHELIGKEEELGKARVLKKKGLGNLNNNVNCNLNPSTACKVLGSCAHRRARRESTKEGGHSNNERTLIVQPYKA